MELTTEQLEEIVVYADMKSADRRIFINSKLLPKDTNLYDFNLFSSDVAQGIIILGDGFSVGNCDVSYEILSEEMGRTLECYGYVINRKEDETVAYTNGGDMINMTYLHHEDKSLIGKEDKISNFFKETT